MLENSSTEKVTTKCLHCTTSLVLYKQKLSMVRQLQKFYSIAPLAAIVHPPPRCIHISKTINIYFAKLFLLSDDLCVKVLAADSLHLISSSSMSVGTFEGRPFHYEKMNKLEAKFALFKKVFICFAYFKALIKVEDTTSWCVDVAHSYDVPSKRIFTYLYSQAKS